MEIRYFWVFVIDPEYPLNIALKRWSSLARSAPWYWRRMTRRSAGCCGIYQLTSHPTQCSRLFHLELPFLVLLPHRLEQKRKEKKGKVQLKHKHHHHHQQQRRIKSGRLDVEHISNIFFAVKIHRESSLTFRNSSKQNQSKLLLSLNLFLTRMSLLCFGKLVSVAPSAFS